MYENCSLNSKMMNISLSNVANSKERGNSFDLISHSVKKFTYLQDKQKLYWILNCEV